MNPFGLRILEVLQASFDGHLTGFNVFSVLDTDGYNVTKHEFEEACKKLQGANSALGLAGFAGFSFRF